MFTVDDIDGDTLGGSPTLPLVLPHQLQHTLSLSALTKATTTDSDFLSNFISKGLIPSF
jgi:hypothetical protein